MLPEHSQKTLRLKNPALTCVVSGLSFTFFSSFNASTGPGISQCLMTHHCIENFKSPTLYLLSAHVE